MFIALDKLHNQSLKQAIIVVPEKSIGSSFHDEELSKHGFWADWHVAPKWNLCDAPGKRQRRQGQLGRSVSRKCRQGTSLHPRNLSLRRRQVRVEAFDDRLIAVDEFHHVSSTPVTSLACTWGSSSPVIACTS